MKKTNSRKLAFKPETLRNLSPRELGRTAGGTYTDDTYYAWTTIVIAPSGTVDYTKTDYNAWTTIMKPGDSK